MLCWHKKAWNILEKIYTKTQQTWNWPVNFLLVIWASNIWKSYIIKQFVNKFNLFQQDVLWLKDLSEKLWKKHNLKVEVDDTIVEIDNKRYLDMWAREIIQWIEKTPAWKYKTVVIENLWRLTINAANALLKTFEEPPNNTLIIWTVNSEKNILDTILSRAMIIKLHIPTFNQIKDCIKEKFPNKQEKDLQLAYNLSWWRIGFMIRILKEENNFLDLFNQIIKLKEEKYSFKKKADIIKDIKEISNLDTFLDALMFYYNSIWKYNIVEQIKDIKQMYSANVKDEWLLFNFLIS